MVANPAQPISLLPMLTAAELDCMISEWNATKRDFPRDKCIHHLIEEQASRTPHSIAAVFEEHQLTYHQLEQRANQLANYLKDQGVGPEITVGVCFPRSLDMLIGLLAVLKSGGAYVPLDPAYPKQRIKAVIEDARPALLLTQEEVAADLGEVATRVICLDAAWPTIQLQSTQAPAGRASAENTAYVIFTSGSTGRPKGVQISHRNVVNFLWSMAREPGLSADDRLLAVTTPAFDISVLELFLPLTVGARVIIAEQDILADGFKLKQRVLQSGTTVLQTTPATWWILLAAQWTDMPELKILCGGEALPRDLADALLARSSSVWNMYGPTETTVWSSASRVEPGSGAPTIGRPIANTTFHVLDRAGQLCPIGVQGELHIGGEGVARAYWNDPELTAAKFVHDPFTADPGSHLYRTGDLVRRLPDGRLEFLGRLDTQVKVRGFRIETAEVETVLGQHPSVRQCVVVVREDIPGDRRLVAYVVGHSVSARDLRAFTAERLPDYMVPSMFVPLDALPYTPNGKVDRRALPAPHADSAGRDRDFVGPRNPREETLARISAEVLALNRVSVEESLFDLGADSLHVFRIVARATEAGLHLTLKQILTHRTVTAICADLERSGNVPRKNQGPQIVPGSREKYRVRRSELSAS
jgi:amino acid adenylation domain-containing protein